MQAAVKGVATTPEVYNATHLAYAIEDAPLAGLSPDHRTEKDRQAFLAVVQVNESPLNLLIDTGSHVSILSATAYYDLNDI